eukprot:tig00000254_g22461.t1
MSSRVPAGAVKTSATSMPTATSSYRTTTYSLGSSSTTAVGPTSTTTVSQSSSVAVTLPFDSHGTFEVDWAIPDAFDIPAPESATPTCVPRINYNEKSYQQAQAGQKTGDEVNTPTAKSGLLDKPVGGGSSRCGNGVLEPGEGCDKGAWNGLPSSNCTLACTVRSTTTITDGSTVKPGTGSGGGKGGKPSLLDPVPAPPPPAPPAATAPPVPAPPPPAPPATSEPPVPAPPPPAPPATSEPPAGACGNGVLDAGEACDLGVANGLHWSSCSATCTPVSAAAKPAVCGNNVVEAGEECDQGVVNGLSMSTCSATCRTVVPSAPLPSQTCGNGVLEGTEGCDLGAMNGLPTSACSAACTIVPLPPPPSELAPPPPPPPPASAAVCGNGILEDGEFCDLGMLNGLSASACSAYCQPSVPATPPPPPPPPPSEPAPIEAPATAPAPAPAGPACGNGFIEAGEQCDEGHRSVRPLLY